MAGEGGTETEFSGLVDTFQRHVDDLRGLIQCGICVRPLYEPFTIACGHTFCYSCLASWFAAKKSKRTCPDCRALVKDQPAPAYLVRAIVQIFTSRPELLDKEYTAAEHSKNHQEESERLDKDKANTDPVSGGLFGGLFKPPPPKPIVDIEDGVTRCPLCSYELEDGWNCQGCGYVYQPDSEGTDYSGSSISESDLGSMIEGDTSDEDDYAPAQPPREEPSVRSFPPQAPFDFHGDYTNLFMNAFPGMRMNWHPLRVNHTNHSTHFWPQYTRPNPYDDEAEDDDDDDPDASEEEEEDEYGGSFIDDGEDEEDNEENESQSDRSTVVGQTRIHNEHFSRIPPLVRYPPVVGPSSSPGEFRDWGDDMQDYGDWHASDMDDMQDFHDWRGSEADGARHSIPRSLSDGNLEVLSEDPISHPSDQNTDTATDTSDDSGSENDCSSSPVVDPRSTQRSRGTSLHTLLSNEMTRRRSHQTVPPARRPALHELSSEGRRQRMARPIQPSSSSSPPMARQSRGRPSRDTGSSARNAITIDDSDEDPVGPIRRTGQRQQVRFSPY